MLFFKKKTHLFLRKHPNCEQFGNFYHSNRIYGRIASIRCEKVSSSEMQANMICSVSSIGKHRVKNRIQFRGRFCLDIQMIIRQNIVRQRFVFSKIFSVWLGTASPFFLKNLTLEFYF